MPTDIEKELQSLVSQYVTFDKENNKYPEPTDTINLRTLDEQFNQIIKRTLLDDGPTEEGISSNYKSLIRLFHPDKLKQNNNPAIVWLEQVLTEGTNHGHCFKSLRFRYEILIEPHRFKEINFSEIRNTTDFKHWLEQSKNKADTYVSRNFYQNLLDLLEQSKESNSLGLKAVLTLFTAIFSTCGALIIGEELFALYALYLTLFTGGKYLEGSDFIELQQLGRSMKDLSRITAATTSTLLVYLLQLTFWTSQQCYGMSLSIGSAILGPLLMPSSQFNKDFSGDLILASKYAKKGAKFENPALKLIVAPFEHYLGVNAQQLFKPLRAGGIKRQQVKNLIFAIRDIDRSPGDLNGKIIKTKEVIEELQSNTVFYSKGSGAAKATDQALAVVVFLMKNLEEETTNTETVSSNPPNMQLILHGA